MKVLSEITPLDPISTLHGVDEMGHIASIIWAEESTRLSTNFIFLSSWLTRDGGLPVRVEGPAAALLGFPSWTTSARTCFVW